MSVNKKSLIDVTNMSANEIIHLIANNPELIERLAVAKAEQDRREAERVKREADEKLAKYNAQVSPLIGAVIQGIEETSEADYEYAGETIIHTSAGDLVMDGTVREIRKKGAVDE